MFERVYQTSMKYGSRILFAAALLLFVFGILGAIYQIGRLGPDNEIRANWILMLNLIFAGATNAILPLIGSIAIHGFDRWQSSTPNERAADSDRKTTDL